MPLKGAPFRHGRRRVDDARARQTSGGCCGVFRELETLQRLNQCPLEAVVLARQPDSLISVLNNVAEETPCRLS
jgi:hypothetical protein